MAALAKFLGKEVPMRAGVGGEIEFPHVKTPSAHWEKTDVPPPADELDPNEDLWGKWSGQRGGARRQTQVGERSRTVGT